MVITEKSIKEAIKKAKQNPIVPESNSPRAIQQRHMWEQSQQSRRIKENILNRFDELIQK